MAVSHHISQLQMLLKFQSGVNDKGNPVYSTRTYSSVNTDATYDQIMDVAQGLGDLCTYPLDEISRVQKEILVNG